MKLQRSLANDSVLSVYAGPTPADPAARNSWRIELRDAIRDLRGWLSDSPAQERKRFEACVATLATVLEKPRVLRGAGGWVAFITPDGVIHSGPIRVTMPSVAVWSTGPCVGPLIRTLKEARPVTLVLVDSRKAAVHRYAAGEVRRVAVIRARRHAQAPLHMGRPPRSGYHPGTRGRTGAEARQRRELAATRHLLDTTVKEVLKIAGRRGGILVAGARIPAAALARELEEHAPGRVLRIRSVSMDASSDLLGKAARAGASQLRNSIAARHIGPALMDDDPKGWVVGLGSVRQALEKSGVQELFFTHSFLGNAMAEAEPVIRAAIREGAWVEEISGESARQLDARGGVAARLRY
ncbi:MAG TPA: hypothetical protein VMM17_07830 [Gemmatimonadaceae bacterium]|nr:hypothetical protein [Gemmatimonadaceae bacterium]